MPSRSAQTEIGRPRTFCTPSGPTPAGPSPHCTGCTGRSPHCPALNRANTADTWTARSDSDKPQRCMACTGSEPAHPDTFPTRTRCNLAYPPLPETSLPGRAGTLWRPCWAGTRPLGNSRKTRPRCPAGTFRRCTGGTCSPRMTACTFQPHTTGTRHPRSCPCSRCTSLLCMTCRPVVLSPTGRSPLDTQDTWRPPNWAGRSR